MMHNDEFLHLVNDAKTRIREITSQTLKEWKEKQKPFYLIDVREDFEWESGHIEGAIHLAKGIIERDILKSVTDQNADVVLYCSGGFRSALAADNLQKMGYKSVFSLAGGYKDWIQS